ncbi:MAG TPA: hypothetical protein VES93_11895 [Ornithinibacter sp.]|nr:hypothetical protein [Ornithinibacter sp.]
MPDRPGDMDERDVDARFASIIARWDGPAPEAADATAESEEPARPHSAGDDPGPSAHDTRPAGPAPATVEGPERDGTEQGVTDPDAAEQGATDPDAAERPVPPVTPRAPWVNPSPLDVVVPPSAWRAAEPADAATEAAAEQAEAALADDEHFEPPEVVLPPQEDLHFWGAVIGLVAGPLLLLWVVFARPSHSTRWFIVSVLVSLLGFALLVLRQPKHRDPTSGDNGARV